MNVEWNNDMDVSDLNGPYMEASDSSNPPFDTYDAEIIEVGFKYTQKGDRQFVVIYDIMEGDYMGRKIFLNYALKPSMMWKLKRDVKLMGLKQFENVEALRYHRSEFIGLQHTVRTFGREYEGKTYGEFEIVKVIRGPQNADPNYERPPAEDEIPF